MSASLSERLPGLPLGSRPARRRSRYSRFVGFMRFLLPATALVLTALLVLWPHLMGGSGSLIMPMFVEGASQALDAMQMERPRYAGRTKEGRPYTVQAVAAEIDPGAPDRIQLDQLAANVDTTRRGLELAAPSGVYHRVQEELDLAGGIELLTSDGYRFETETARVLLQDGRVVGRQPIAGSGPAGTLEADQFEIRSGGEVMRFEGRVKVMLQTRQTGDGANS
jgi:lipopolysaccharide export system protein LptC